MKKYANFKGFDFEAFGAKIGVRSNAPEVLTMIETILPEVIPENLEFKKIKDAEHIFTIEYEDASGKFYISKNGEELTFYTGKDRLVEYLCSQIRITVAEFAESKVFLHAGAVGWKDSAIIIPGSSYSGKTTLVSELIRYGAEYYSDEYAVLDEEGFLHPYPKMLSMRGIINEYDQVDTPPHVFGAKIGKKKIPVGLILITEFESETEWNPQILNAGEGIMEILQHTIPIRFKPDFVLKVLKKTASRAIIAKSKRGDAKVLIPLILKYFEAVRL
ncbi:hypothetical protein BH20ACI4_BH20ACI4_00290 [soil metagenome]